MKKKDEGRPLAELALDPGFSRNYAKMMMERENGDPELKELITSAIVTAAAERVTGKQRHAEASAKGGEGRREGLAGDWHRDRERIILSAKQKLAGGTSKRDLAGILAQIHGLTAHRIRQILREEGI